MLKVENLCKEYNNFKLKNVTFQVPTGYIVGFIGKNGAGKSTTIKTMFNIEHPDKGKVLVEGKDYYQHELELKQQIGLSLGSFNYYRGKKIKTLTDVYKRFYHQWDEAEYRKYMSYFNLDENKRIKELSEGMRSKYAIVLALSHHAKLLVLDEPTSGLDPIARRELLELFQKFIQDGDKSILFSTHITSDLDKCADYIVLIRNGEIVANDTKDDFVQNHRLITGPKKLLTHDLQQKLIGYKLSAFGFEGLISSKELPQDIEVRVAQPNIEELLYFYNMEEEHDKTIL